MPWPPPKAPGAASPERSCTPTTAPSTPAGPFADACRRAAVRQSMSAVGSSADNALAESFNATFKRETLQGRKHWSGERKARLDAFRWLNRHNTRRHHSRLGHRSPVAFETASRTPSTTLNTSRIIRAQDSGSRPTIGTYRFGPADVAVIGTCGGGRAEDERPYGHDCQRCDA
ncbi:integrase core domain-containing protein [Streptomyces sp. SYSU K217416]